MSEVEDLTTSPARAGTSTRVADPHRSPLKRGWAEVFANPKAKKKTKPLHPSWDYFRRGSKKNSAHHNAHCLACDAAGTPSTVGGTLQPMLKHLRECAHCPTEAKQLADPDKAANQSGNDQQLEASMHTIPQASAWAEFCLPLLMETASRIACKAMGIVMGAVFFAASPEIIPCSGGMVFV